MFLFSKMNCQITIVAEFIFFSAKFPWEVEKVPSIITTYILPTIRILFDMFIWDFQLLRSEFYRWEFWTEFWLESLWKSYIIFTLVLNYPVYYVWLCLFKGANPIRLLTWNKSTHNRDDSYCGQIQASELSKRNISVSSFCLIILIVIKCPKFSWCSAVAEFETFLI